MDGKTIGILGGGQLGRMIVEAAHRLNIKTIILQLRLTHQLSRLMHWMNMLTVHFQTQSLSWN